MAGRRELGFPKNSTCSLKEQLARVTLRNVRLQGHEYVELREDGKRFVFFCTLCLSPCYSDTILFDHLKGSLHKGRLEAAKATLLKPNPWPFNDGVLFFQPSSPEKNEQLMSSSLDKTWLLDHNIGNGNELAIVCRDKSQLTAVNKSYSNMDHHSGGSDDTDSNGGPEDEGMSINGAVYDLVVPGVLLGDEVSDIGVRLVGVGKIAVRFLSRDEVPNGLYRIWCEWLGNNHDIDTDNAPEDEFAIVTFAYNCTLGRKGLLDDVKYLLSSSPRGETADSEDGRKKRRRSFSDPEDISESLSNQCDSSGDDSPSSNTSSSRMLLDCQDDQVLLSRFMSSKTRRRELRRQQRVAAEKMCGICQQKMLPGKDVGTLLNRKTGRLVCSSRNQNGAFHVFHISCLIHWILLCEFEIYVQQFGISKMKRSSKRKSGAKCNTSKEMAEIKVLKKQIDCVFCPECQGSGVCAEGDELEKPTMALSEIFRYKIKVSDAHRSWMDSPEVLQNCSTGFHFPSQSDDPVQEHVTPLKLLRFYRIDG